MQLSDTALASVKTLPAKIRIQIAAKLERIAASPRSCNAKPLQGRHHGYLRVRSGDYRIVYIVDHVAHFIRIVGIFNRKDGYD